jgi:ubiquinone biosynthesis protein Coq4
VRARLLRSLFDATHRLWAATKRAEPWNLTVPELLAFPAGTLGRTLGEHLHAEGFELIPCLEAHDVWHLVTHVGTDVPSEIELQFVLAGNGKRSLYLVGTLVIGMAVYPEQRRRFAAGWDRGRRSERFHDLDVREMLGRPVGELGSRVRVQA